MSAKEANWRHDASGKLEQRRIPLFRPAKPASITIVQLLEPRRPSVQKMRHAKFDSDLLALSTQLRLRSAPSATSPPPRSDR